MSRLIYNVDAFTLHAASSIAANTVIQSTDGAVLLASGLSKDVCNSAVNLIVLALCPMPWSLLKYWRVTTSTSAVSGVYFVTLPNCEVHRC